VTEHLDGPDDEASSFVDHRLGRKDFLFDSAKILAAAAAAGPFFMAQEHAEAATRASTSSDARVADPIAKSAVDAAKKFSGATLTKTNEAGLQALDDKNFTGPLWEKLTGVKVSVIEKPFAEIYSTVIAEHIARSGAIDSVDGSPVWVPDFAEQEVLAPIDGFIRKYRAQSTMKDYHPLYRPMMKYKGKQYGFFDDGDVWTLYYRKDVFGNAKLRNAYRAKFGKALRVPRGWDEFTETAQFITDQMAPQVYGTGLGRTVGNPGNQFYFYQQFRSNGGQFFNPRTMKALINNRIGVRTMNQILAQNKASPPGVEKLDVVSAWVQWLEGKTAMIFSWPPTGRMSENYAQRDKAFAFIPKSKIVGKVGYAIVPGQNGEHAGSFIKGVMATSEQQELAYLFNQWATSPSISLQRVQLPYTLRDPYRISHYRSKQFWGRWPSARQYLAKLAEGANYAVLDPIYTGSQDYANALDRGMSKIYAGGDVQKTLDDVAKEWDAITRRLGVDKQRASYRNFLNNYLGSTKNNTPARKGQAVKI
jgi:multiple sugar transport system substrate-binding protein